MTMSTIVDAQFAHDVHAIKLKVPQIAHPIVRETAPEAGGCGFRGELSCLLVFCRQCIGMKLLQMHPATRYIRQETIDGDRGLLWKSNLPC